MENGEEDRQCVAHLVVLLISNTILIKASDSHFKLDILASGVELGTTI